MATQNAVNLLRAQYRQMQEWLEGTMQGVTDEVARYDPPGAASPIGAQAGHIVSGLDFFLVGGVAGKQPLALGSFADKTGMSESPPQGSWQEWGARVEIDLPALHAYSKAVLAEVDTILASLTDDDLEQKKEFGGAGEQTVVWAFNILLLNSYCHTGEIACIKGMQGLQGYPF